MPKAPRKLTPSPIPPKKIPAGKKLPTPKGLTPKNSQATMKRGTVVKPAIPSSKWNPAE